MNNFNEIINSSTPTLVDFYANWCAPCRMMPPILKQVKNAVGDNIRIIKVDVDKNPKIAAKYRIQSIPTIMLFKDGEQKWQGLGVHQANQLIQQINQQQI